MGMLTDAMYAESRECILTANESGMRGIGSTGAMFKSVVMPQLVDVRAKLAALPPEQKQQLAQQIAQTLKDSSEADRKAFQEGLGKGFFPPEVLEKVAGQSGPR
jgi:hypothetical protein